MRASGDTKKSAQQLARPAAAVDALVRAFGDAFCPSARLPNYDLRFDAGEAVATIGDATYRERPSEWKRLSGQIWSHTLPATQQRALGVLLPTLSEFDGAFWKPMSALLESKPVVEALDVLAEALKPNDPEEAFCCTHSALFGQSAYNVPAFKRTKVAKSLDASMKARGAMSAMMLVKGSVEHLGDAKPMVRLSALAWLREAMRESPANVLGIHRLFVTHVVPLADQQGLWREAALGVLERWVPRLVARSAHPEALPLLDRLIAYGVGVPTFLASKYQTLLALDRPEDAEPVMARLAAIGDARQVVSFGRYNGFVDDARGQALWTVAKLFRQIAESEHPFGESRRRGEPSPPAVSREKAKALCRAYAKQCVDIFQELAKTPTPDGVSMIRPSYAFYIDSATGWLG